VVEHPFGVEPAEGETETRGAVSVPFRRPRLPRLPKPPRPDLNEVLVMAGLPICGVALWQLTPHAFWAGAALLGALAAAWGVYRASR
jgi:hypothetical protein